MHAQEASAAGFNDEVCIPAPEVSQPTTGDWSFSRDGLLLQPRNRAAFVEVFAGSGRLTKHVRSFGVDGWAVGWKDGRLAHETPAFLLLNLTAAADPDALRRLLLHPQLRWVHFAPPCGTASRAREIPMKNSEKHGSPPLRSELFPLGLPGLEVTRPRDFARVQAANELYRLTAELAAACIEKGIAVSVENPRDSLMWWVPAMRTLAERRDTAFS